MRLIFLFIFYIVILLFVFMLFSDFSCCPSIFSICLSFCVVFCFGVLSLFLFCLFFFLFLIVFIARARFIFLFCYGIVGMFLFYLVRFQKTDNIDDIIDDKKRLTTFNTLIYLFIGGFFLWLGSEVLVQGAVELAMKLGVSERIISISVVSIGTSIPELSASIIAITMGIGTIMEAKNILLLGLGQHKSKAVADLVEGPLSSFCPGSVLQNHENAVIVLDQLAASNLKLYDYYIHSEKMNVEYMA